VDVIGHQWQWEIRYPEAPDFSSTNVLTVPVGSVVKINLTSTDVIHSFWVPELAGKTDAMPHITNTMWFRADSPRTYRGQCAEFCGLLHSRMWLDVVAIPQETYNQWFASIKPQGTPIAQPPTQGGPELGQALFQRGGGGATPCSVCHSLQPGVQIVGPSLAGVATRAAGREPGKNAHDYLKESIVDPNAFIVPGFSKPSPMPGNFGQVYSDEQIESLVAFLMTQK
jgi:cytochrome c oxidase subunit 2